MKYKLVMKHRSYFGYRWEIHTRRWWWPFWSYRATFFGTAEEAKHFIEVMVQHERKIYTTE